MDDPAKPESPTKRLKTLLTDRQRLSRERRFARRVRDEVIEALDAVLKEHPALHDYPLYEAVVARRLNLDAASARGFVRRVEYSNVDGVTDRELKFIDVVRFMIVSEYLAHEAGATGMEFDLGPFLSERIDPRI